MRLKNKGYTLVELLLSIAVFSIVMVGIASIMSSTLKAYSSANIDVTVQEDCQIAANQIEELLCDASSISAYDPSVGWIFKDDDGPYYDKAISYDGSTVILKELVAGAGYIPHTIAEDVTSFSIDNWKADSNVTVATEKAYNQVVINMTMDKNGTTYSLKRNVYFRNDIENSSFHGINNLMSEAGSTGGSSSDDAKTLIVKRYQKYNLTADYQITVPVKLLKKNSSTGGWDVVTDPDGTESNNAIFKLTKENNAPAGSYDYVYYLTTGTNVDDNFNFTTSGEYRIEGSGIKIDLKVQEVKLLTDGVVIQHHNAESVNGEGFTTPINVQGININDGLNTTDGLKMKAKYKIIKEDGTVKADFTSLNDIKGCTTGIVKADETTCGTAVQPNGIDTTLFGMFPDPFLGGLSVLGRNDKLKDNTGASFLRTDGDLYFVFSFEVESRGVSQSIPDAKIKFNAMGVTF